MTDGSVGSFSVPNWDAPLKTKTTPEGVFLVTCFGSVTVCSFCDHFVLPDCVALGMMGRKIHLSVNTPQATCLRCIDAVTADCCMSLFPENKTIVNLKFQVMVHAFCYLIHLAVQNFQHILDATQNIVL